MLGSKNSGRRRKNRAAAPAHPAKVLITGFLIAIGVGAGLLMLPFSVTGPGGAPPLVALFTATSAVSVTGLIVVDTAVYWTGFGQLVILALIQIGGLGIMTAASLLTILMARRLGLRSKLVASASVRSVGIGDVRRVVKGVAATSAIVEGVVAVILCLRLALGHDTGIARAIWEGVFTSISAFNNAGFALRSNSLMDFVSDPWILLPIAVAIIIGGLGFPVILEVRKQFRLPARWSMHVKLVLTGTAALLVLSTVVLTTLEWNNPDTLGPLDPGGRVLAGFFSAVVTRTAGFNVIDVGSMTTQSLFTQDLFMFIGGGPAGTAGGVKITTFLVLLAIIVTELRGETAVNIFGRRLARSVHREALTVALLSVALVVAGTWFLLLITHFTLDQILFEVVSAFGTVGLSTGITASLPPAGQVALMLIMVIGRLGPITIGSALALRTRKLMFEYPRERPIIG